MRYRLTVGLTMALLAGCAAPNGPWTAPQTLLGAPELVPNPVLVSPGNPESVWSTVADVMSDFFRIDREEPVHVVGNTLTEGRLETYPQVGATLLEPWAGDSANAYERLESTLQTIRRRSVVRVIPAEGGYLIEVVVLKELEDCKRPEHSTSGQAAILYDDTLNRLVNPVGGEDITKGWIPLGRDAALEQRIVSELRLRIGAGVPPRPSALGGSNCGGPAGDCAQPGVGPALAPPSRGPSLGPAPVLQP